MMRALLLLVLVVGCDDVFSVDEVPPIENCRAAGDPASHDEDSDGIDDSCDNCPTVANLFQEDTLEIQGGEAPDGVGDACDPNPFKTGDAQLGFYSFTASDVGTRFRVLGGDWHNDGDDLVYTSIGGPNAIVDQGPPPDPPFTVELVAQVDSIGSPVAGFEILTEADMAGKAVHCGLYRNATADYVLLRGDYGGAGYASMLPARWQSGEYTLTFLYDPTPMGPGTCSVVSPEQQGAVPAQFTLAQPHGALGISATNAVVHVHSMVVYGSSN